VRVIYLFVMKIILVLQW